LRFEKEKWLRTTQPRWRFLARGGLHNSRRRPREHLYRTDNGVNPYGGKVNGVKLYVGYVGKVDKNEALLCLRQLEQLGKAVLLRLRRSIPLRLGRLARRSARIKLRPRSSEAVGQNDETREEK
jgi:hypothetical protein